MTSKLCHCSSRLFSPSVRGDKSPRTDYELFHRVGVDVAIHSTKEPLVMKRGGHRDEITISNYSRV